jgi:hypothetical protein
MLTLDWIEERVSSFHLAPLAGRGLSRSEEKASGEGNSPQVSLRRIPLTRNSRFAQISASPGRRGEVIGERMPFRRKFITF